MLQTEMTTNTFNNNEAMKNVISETNKQAAIVKRLEELNKWQEEQKKLLEARQIMQRQMLGMEQQTMYQMLGLRQCELSEGEETSKSITKAVVETEDYGLAEEYEEDSTDDSPPMSQLDNEEEAEEDGKEDIEPSHYKNSTPGYGTEDCFGANKEVKAKRNFLKRGEGLKQRFKIDPDKLRIHNLPRYKYANVHSKPRLKLSNKNIKSKDLNNKPQKTTNLSPKTTKPRTTTILDEQEQIFQNVLKSSKNMCSSTPDTKTSFSNKTDKVPNTPCSASIVHFTDSKMSASKKIQEFPPNEGPPNSTVSHTVAWSKILDPLEIEPIQVPRIHSQQLPQTEESIFELLEQKANNGSLDMNSTCLKQFMQRRISEKLNETDDSIPVQEYLKTKRLEPVIVNERVRESSSLSLEEIDEEQSQLTENSLSAESDDSTRKTVETTEPSQTTEVRVRFSDSNETHEYEEDLTRLTAGSMEQEGQGDTSNNEFFEQFKEALFAALKLKSDQHQSNESTLYSVSETTLTPKDSIIIPNNDNNYIHPSACTNLQEKTNMIKFRLSELEKEISNFKENNILLMKAKQEHELKKSLHAQEHLEAMERLKDEKIQMEIYLHDERVKLEDEKRQFEQTMKMKTQGLISKKRKECESLREQVTELEIQLKTKEANHTSAQARLRTQIRNMEREHNNLHERIEQLMKENKRLENENLKIRREQDNKILLEINRNIAKLAPKQIQHSSTSIPEEGPPTLGASRTVSKCIVAAATANKNFGKTHKATNARLPIGKHQNNKKASPPPSVETDLTPETSFIQEQEQGHQQKYVVENDEDDEDILEEFQMTPTKRCHTPTMTQTEVEKSNRNKSSIKLSPKRETQTPAPPPSSPRRTTGNNMKREITNADGSVDIWYPNGNLKKISADGMIIRMLYYNKDIKETNINEGTVKYYYAETNTWHTSYLDGLEILEFPNGQLEHRHKNGVVEVHYPNNSVKIIDPKDEYKQEEWRFADGTHLVQMRNGDKILSLPNGQKEIHNKLHKRREYPDGTVKIVYPDGSTETRYSNGRIRLKDKDGKLVMDTNLAN